MAKMKIEEKSSQEETNRILEEPGIP